MMAEETFEREAAEAGFVVDRIYPLFRGIHAQHIVILRRGQAPTLKTKCLGPDPSLVYTK